VIVVFLVLLGFAAQSGVNEAGAIGLTVNDLGTLVLAVASHAEGEKLLVNKNKDGRARQGYDPVAYFTDQKPAKGSSAFTPTYHGARHHFVSQEHHATFANAPAKYASKGCKERCANTTNLNMESKPNDNV
jgi:YHS domain-containing protein